MAYLYFIKIDVTIEFQTEVNTPNSLGVVVSDCFHVEGTMPREIRERSGFVHAVSFPIQRKGKWKPYMHWLTPKHRAIMIVVMAVDCVQQAASSIPNKNYLFCNFLQKLSFFIYFFQLKRKKAMTVVWWCTSFVFICIIVFWT